MMVNTKVHNLGR